MTPQQKPDDFKSQFESGCPPCNATEELAPVELAVNLVRGLIEFESSVTKPNLVKPYTVRRSAEDEIRGKSGLGWLEGDFQLARSNKAAAPVLPLCTW
jgi:hypothetical protein